MKITIDIDISNAKALALLDYIRTLDFVSINEDKAKLTNEQKKAIDEGLKSLKQGRKIPHNEVMKQFKQKYPQ